MNHPTVTVGGAALYPGKTIVENAVASPIHTTLVAAVTAAGLVDTVSGAGPFTVFVPVAQSDAGRAGSERISMTAPVAQAPAGADRWTVQFLMPAAYAMDELPVPRDPAVELVVVPVETYAVLKFSGRGSVRTVDARTAELMSGLTGGGWSPNAEPVTWFYDPPWTIPALRRTEVAVRVEPTETGAATQE